MPVLRTTAVKDFNSEDMYFTLSYKEVAVKTHSSNIMKVDRLNKGKPKVSNYF